MVLREWVSLPKPCFCFRFGSGNTTFLLCGSCERPRHGHSPCPDLPSSFLETGTLPVCIQATESLALALNSLDRVSRRVGVKPTWVWQCKGFRVSRLSYSQGPAYKGIANRRWRLGPQGDEGTTNDAQAWKQLSLRSRNETHVCALRKHCGGNDCPCFATVPPCTLGFYPYGPEDTLFVPSPGLGSLGLHAR